MIRILYDHQYFAVDRGGGIARYFLELARHMSSMRDCEVSWFRGFHRDEFDISEFRGRLARYHAIEKEDWWLLGREVINRTNLIAFARFCRASPAPYDIYHPSGYDYSVVKASRAKRVVVTIHDLIPELFFGGDPQYQPLINAKRRLIELADCIITPSEHTKRDLVEMMGVSPDRIRAIYQGTDLRETAPAPLANLPNRPFLLYVGSRARHKNFGVLLEAFASHTWLSNKYSVVCFGGKGGFTSRELEFLAAHSLSNTFFYASGDDHFLRSLYEGAEALVHTSKYEGFGLPPLEAMELGCPVVCVPTSAVLEVVGKCATFFSAENADELASQLQRLLSDEHLKSEMVLAGKERALGFSWRRTAERTLDLYRAL